MEALIVIILFQYISGMATGGQASNVSYSSVSQSSDGGVCATGSGLPSSGMWRHTTARTGPRRERAIRFRDAWVEEWFKHATSMKAKRIVPLNRLELILHLKKYQEKSSIKCSNMLQDYDLSSRDASAAERKNIASDARTTWRMDINREISTSRNVYLTWIHIATIKICKLLDFRSRNHINEQFKMPCEYTYTYIQSLLWAVEEKFIKTNVG